MGLYFAIRRTLLMSPLLALVGCGASPSEQCHDGSSAFCRRLFECAAGSMLSSPDFLSQYGATESECVAKQTAACSVGSSCHESGFDGARAVDCVADMEAASCQSFIGGEALHNNCEAVCITPLVSPVDDED